MTWRRGTDGNRLRLGVAALLVIVGLAAGALVIAGFAGGSGAVAGRVNAAGPPPAVAPNISRDGIPDPTWTPTATPTNTPTPTPTPAPPPHPTSAAGLRVWSDGDSTSYYMTVGFFSIMSDLGAIPVRAADYKISSGLANSGSSAVLGVAFSDWPSYMASEMATYAPDVVVFMIGANDAGFAHSNPDEYRARVAALMDQLEAPGRYVMWVGEPNITRSDLAPIIPELNQIYADEAAKRAWVTYVDASSITSDGGDGVHLSPSAGRAIAQLVVDALLNP